MHSDPHTYAADLFGDAGIVPLTNTPVRLDPVLFPTSQKRRFAHPTHLSRIPSGTDIATAIYGAGLMGLGLFRQGEEAAALLNARRPDGHRLYQEFVQLVPRRSAKTTADWAEILGRAATSPRLTVLTTAQDGTRAREIMRDIIMEDLRAAGAERRGLVKFRIANGTESITFPATGSLIKAVPPKPASFRSKAADVVFIDEAGEIDDDLGRALLGAVLPLMDTRPDGQLIVSGTPPESRAGLLWAELQKALNPKQKHIAVQAYMLRDNESAAIISDDGTRELNKRIIMRVHPGIGTLTTLATIRARFDAMTLTNFEREYGCRFPFDLETRSISAADWAACSAGPVLPDRPDRPGIAFDVDPDGSTAALVAAWRDDAGHALGEVLDVRAGTDWLPGQAQRAAAKHRVAVAFDSIGANHDPAQVLGRLRVRTTPLVLRHMQAATTRLAREIATRNARHFDQADFDRAVEGAVWRTVGEGGRLFGRKASSASVCPLVAWSAALWQYDQTSRRPGVAGAVLSGASS